MIEVNSFAELRTTKPSASGEIALLKRYYDKDSTFQGGGRFVGFIDAAASASADDGGSVAVGSAGGYFWRRIIDNVEDINIYHFGGSGCAATAISMRTTARSTIRPASTCLNGARVFLRP